MLADKLVKYLSEDYYHCSYIRIVVITILINMKFQMISINLEQKHGFQDWMILICQPLGISLKYLFSPTPQN